MNRQASHNTVKAKVSAKCSVVPEGKPRPNHSGCTMNSCVCPCHAEEAK